MNTTFTTMWQVRTGWASVKLIPISMKVRIPFYKFFSGTVLTVYCPGLPYWFNALVPLAYGLDDDRLKDQVHSAMGIVLERQFSDGWLGPETGTWRNFWGRMPMVRKSALGYPGIANLWTVDGHVPTCTS